MALHGAQADLMLQKKRLLKQLNTAKHALARIAEIVEEPIGDQPLELSPIDWHKIYDLATEKGKS